jgi:nitrogen regulatory protein PII
MTKMVMITYNEAIDLEVMEVLHSCGISNYTKVAAAFGKGETSGTHLGSDIWPGRNNILYVACNEIQVKQVISCVKELRKKLGREGIKAFVLPVEETT